MQTVRDMLEVLTRTIPIVGFFMKHQVDFAAASDDLILLPETLVLRVRGLIVARREKSMILTMM